MGAPVKVKVSNTVEKISTVMDDELHQLVLEGRVSLKDAVKALKNAGIALDKRFYPWLRLVENKATGEFDQNQDAKPSVPGPAPDLLSEEAEQKLAAEPDPIPEAVQPANPEGAK